MEFVLVNERRLEVVSLWSAPKIRDLSILLHPIRFVYHCELIDKYMYILYAFCMTSQFPNVFCSIVHLKIEHFYSDGVIFFFFSDEILGYHIFGLHVCSTPDRDRSHHEQRQATGQTRKRKVRRMPEGTDLF